VVLRHGFRLRAHVFFMFRFASSLAICVLKNRSLSIGLHRTLDSGVVLQTIHAFLCVRLERMYVAVSGFVG
jgi:hypothetical protein